ncbi:hypothetical protein GGQ80_000790 [Sphingomonas jinjuensis]|uniref:Uncharacterized protein n=1 Tax=Sphingomonas jinjuensis TaxID=535907 RepID=A0A840F8G7_9SPHN|nr:hypothetical protein [Sphingomonas jinjuensis]MBB4152902.1 hypothetical protein [Sphingomonas jinjuensis]
METGPAPADQPAAIADRGEHDLELAGVTYRLRPSRAALRTIEKKTGATTLALIQAGNVGGLTLEQLGIIGAELIRAGAGDELTRSVNADRIEELIFEEGLSGAHAALTLCLMDAATGGRTASGEAKAAAA